MIEAKNVKIYSERPWLKYYPEGVATTYEPVDDVAVPDMFDEACHKWDKIAIVFYGRKIGYRELRNQVYSFANGLSNLGIGKGDVVGLYLINSPAFVIAYFGALKAGATVTPISPVNVSSEVRHQIEDSGAETVICQDILYNHLEQAEVKLKNVILTSIGDFLPPMKKLLGKSILRSVYQGMEAPSSDIVEREGFHRFQDLLKYPPTPPEVKFNPREDIATLQYTGGTTGLPRAAMHTHYSIVNATRQNAIQAMVLLQEGNETEVAYLPLYHIFGQIGIMIMGLLYGITMVILTSPALDDILEAIEREKVSIFRGAPSLYAILVDHEKTGRINWKRLKYIQSAADALLEDTAKGWERRTGTKLAEAWAMTETLQGTFNPWNRIKFGSVGVPAPGVDMAVADPEKNDLVAPGETGELIIKGPQLMKGYWKHPEETEKVMVEIDNDTWMRTGDLGQMDEEGYFYLYDRKRDRIKYKGYSVFAREIEDVLLTHPQIKDVGVIGVPDPKVGENIKALVVLERDARGKLGEEDIIKYCEENLAHYKVPKIVEFRGEIPKTDIGKVSRRELREE